MNWQGLCLLLCISISSKFCFAQTVLGELEMEDYAHSSKFRCDSYMLTVKTEYRSEPGHVDSCFGSEEFVKLVSKEDDLLWMRARRNAQPFQIPENGQYTWDAIPGQWCRLNLGKQVFGIQEHFSNDRDLFHFESMGSVDPGSLVFPEPFDAPFLTSGKRSRYTPSSILSLFSTKLKCIEANQNSNVVVSKWSYMNGSDVLWEVQSEDGYPVVVRLMQYSKPVMDSVPLGKPLGFIAENKIDWQEDDHGKYPKRVTSSQTSGLPLAEGRVTLIELYFKLDVENDAFRAELAKVKRRLEEIQKRNSK